jgi:hypothetical protein
MRALRAVFHLGIAAGFVVLLSMAALFQTGTIAQISPVQLLVYDFGAVLHIALLGILARRIPEADRAAVPNLFYTAGFLHTLIALGIAIVLAGALLSRNQSDGFSTTDLARVITPMGAAVVPHALGVWIGSIFERQSAAADEAEGRILRALANEGERAQSAFAALYDRRRQVLEDEINAIASQVKLWSTLATSVQSSVQQAESAVGGFSVALQDSLTSARRPAVALEAAVQRLVDRLSEAERNAAQMSRQLASAATSSTQASADFKKASEVVQDLQKLHASIVDLLSHELFRG